MILSRSCCLQTISADNRFCNTANLSSYSLVRFAQRIRYWSTFWHKTCFSHFKSSIFVFNSELRCSKSLLFLSNSSMRRWCFDTVSSSLPSFVIKSLFSSFRFLWLRCRDRDRRGYLWERRRGIGVRSFWTDRVRSLWTDRRRISCTRGARPLK